MAKKKSSKKATGKAPKRKRSRSKKAPAPKGKEDPAESGASKRSSTTHEVGVLVKLFRERVGVSQQALADELDLHRSVIAHLEQGRALPEFENLEKICSRLELPEAHWRHLRDPLLQLRGEFEAVLGELTGQFVSVARLDSQAQRAVVARVEVLFKDTLTNKQCLDQFSSTLVYYGLPGPSRAFFDRFLGPDAFN